jgi:hypothetical protein
LPEFGELPEFRCAQLPVAVAVQPRKQPRQTGGVPGGHSRLCDIVLNLNRKSQPKRRGKQISVKQNHSSFFRLTSKSAPDRSPGRPGRKACDYFPDRNCLYRSFMIDFPSFISSLEMLPSWLVSRSSNRCFANHSVSACCSFPVTVVVLVHVFVSGSQCPWDSRVAELPCDPVTVLLRLNPPPPRLRVVVRVLAKTSIDAVSRIAAHKSINAFLNDFPE